MSAAIYAVRHRPTDRHYIAVTAELGYTPAGLYNVRSDRRQRRSIFAPGEDERLRVELFDLKQQRRLAVST